MTRFILLSAVLIVLTGCQRTEPKQDRLNGRYQFLETGSNVTGTHTHAVGYYLKIDSYKEPNATYFVTDNGDIIGGHKDRYSVVQRGNKVDLVYAGCVDQSFIDDEEAPCTSELKLGKKRYTFERIGNKLKMAWAVNGNDDVVLEKVKAFDFEERHQNKARPPSIKGQGKGARID